MSINYDPDGVPKIPDGLVREARERGWEVVQVICDEPDAKVGDDEGVSFFAMLPYPPRAGDSIILEDRKECRVLHTVFSVYTIEGTYGDEAVTMMIPAVVALSTGKAMPPRPE